MIHGFVTSRREAVVCVVVRGPRSHEEVEAMVDTGFTAFLTLPPSLVEALDLPFKRRGWAMLADGSDISFDVHEAEILWDGRPRIIDVSVADTTPLLGTSLLEGCELAIRFVDDGDVFIKAL